MHPDKALSMIGMAVRAGKAGRGAFLAEAAIKSGKAGLVILARDASENTRKKFQNMCRFYEVELMETASCEALGKICGKEALAVVSIHDENFKAAIQKAAQS